MRASFGRVFEQAAQTVGWAGQDRIAEGGGFASDVVGSAKQLVVRLVVKSLRGDVLARGFETLALGLHPAAKLAR